MKKLLSLLLAVVLALGLLSLSAAAASTPEEALGEVNIYNGGYRMNYLSINGQIQSQNYVYYLYDNGSGTTKEIPAYCVTPNQRGVQKVVNEGESVRYLAEEISSDPKIVGIIASGYPTRPLSALGLENKYQGFYATKMALWCYLVSDWDINDLTVNPTLTGDELARAENILAAAKDIYVQGTSWNEMKRPEVTCVPDREKAYPVTIDGVQYLQQVFTFESKTWVCDYEVSIAIADPASAPEGTRIVDMDGRDITALRAEWTGDGHGGQFKVLYPASSVEDQSGSIQLNLDCDVYAYAVYFAVCQEKDVYGNLQNYVVDTDPTTPIRVSAISNYSDTPDGDPDPEGTWLRILKYETGTEIPLAGARVEVIGPDGDTVGIFVTNDEGRIDLPLTLAGNFTVIERDPPAHHLLGADTAQNVTVRYGETAQVVFYNDPYGTLRIEKKSNTGMNLPGAVITIEHIESGQAVTAETSSAGVAIFDEIPVGAYRIQEETAPEGWLRDDTVYTATVVAGGTATVPIINKELPGLRIIKYDRKNMVAMPDVTFAVYRDGEFLGNFQTDQFGEILLTNVEPGTYRAFEVDTGDSGHLLDSTPQEVELKAGDGIKPLVFFNDLKPGIHLTKVDSGDLSKPIANAKFRFEAVDGSWGPVEYTTLADGTIDLSKLPTGAVVVTELSCPGYVIDEAQRIIHLDPNEDAEFVFTNSKLPSLTLTKTSSDGTPLAGVTFRLAKVEDGGHYLDRTTGPDGTITWEGLEPGVYSLVETATVSDHILDTREHHIQLFPGRDSTIDLENDRRPNLTVVKRDADSGAPISDTVFLVEAADGHSVDEIRTGSGGTATLENLLPGVYQISEKSVPSPYLMDAEPQLVTLYPNRDHTAYFENHKAPTIEIIKENSITHERLSNVRFQVWYASNDTETGEYNDLGVLTTDENGRIELTGPDNGLRDGWFRVKELEPPAGFSIKDSDTQEAFVQAGKGHTFLFENTPLSALVVYKRDSVTGAALPNCRFQLSYLGGSTSGTGGTVIGTYVTSENGSFTVTGLKAGYYICEEVESDGAHVIDSAPQSFYISGEDQDIVTLYFGNAPKGAVLVKKVSSADNSPLSDVEFFVTTADGTVVGDANGKFVTDSAGSFLVEGVEPGTTLVIKETRARPGYLLDDTPQTVQVKEGQTVTVEFRNQPLGNLIIEKWGRNGTSTIPLEGVKFEIKYANGQYVDAAGGTLSSNGIYYTDSAGEITLSSITGAVVVTELESVPGYTIDPDSQSQTVTINPNDTQTLRFYNDAVGGAELTKVSEADKSETISDVTFEIRRVSDDALVDTVTTGRNGKVYISLEAGNYYAVETDCPDTFQLDPTPVYFTVEENRTTPLTVTNAPISGILIHKISTADGEGIPGVSFILYDSTNTPIDQQTTDDRGYAWFEGLIESGRYYLRELENEGYIPDTQLRTVYAKPGETTEVTWENTPITGQIQIIKRSADYNPTTGLPAGALLEGAVFEIYDEAGNVVDTIRSDSRGMAVSKQLPLSRYTIREVKSPDHYGVNEEALTAYLEYEGQILRFEVTNKSLSTGVSISKTGPKEVVSGQPVRYTFAGIANTSNVRLDSFYWRDTLPVQVRLEQVVTGTYNFPGSYKIVYKVNGTRDYRTLADNLSTSQNYTLAASPVALGLAANERVTEIMFVFGQAPAGFAQVEAPVVYCTAVNGLAAGSSFVNVADVGGVYNGQWVQAVTRWVTTVYGKPEPLPRTGY